MLIRIMHAFDESFMCGVGYTIGTVGGIIYLHPIAVAMVLVLIVVGVRARRRLVR